MGGAADLAVITGQFDGGRGVMLPAMGWRLDHRYGLAGGGSGKHRRKERRQIGQNRQNHEGGSGHGVSG